MTAAHVPLPTKLAYGVGAMAYGIKDNGFSTFLLLFYNQVVGLPADQVGLAILVALLIDAFADPLIGTLSDRTHTRWGRRHPWLYGSVLPIALSWLLLWNPPHGSNATILGYLVLTAVLTRTAISTYEVPALAMAPEMTRDYDERTSVTRYRYLFGWAGSMSILMLAYGVLLAPPRGSLTGPLAFVGYHNYAIVGAIAMAVSILISAIGTHRRFAHAPANRIMAESFTATLKGIRKALANRAFGVLMLASFFSYVLQGITFAMATYLYGYVWQFSSGNFLALSGVLFVGVVAAFFTIGPIGKALGKKRAAALLSMVGITIGLLPYALRLLGVFPPVGSPAMLPSVLVTVGIATALSVGVAILGVSMMADVVEAAEERTGRREEGLFYAGSLLVQKCTSGIGILMSGLILSFAGFPAKAVVGQVPIGVLDRLTVVYGILALSLASLAALTILTFPFGRDEHEARLAKLAVTAN